MVRMGVLAAAFVLAAGYLGHAASWRAFEPWPPHEQWVVQAGRVAPWADPGTRAVAHASLKGQVIQVDGDQVARWLRWPASRRPIRLWSVRMGREW